MKKIAILIICVLLSALTLKAQPPTDANGVYLISTETHLTWMSLNYSDPNVRSASYRVVDDITLYSSFTPIGFLSPYYFTGTFDGNNKSISGLNINQNWDDNIGFFSQLGPTGTIKNLALSGSVLGRDNVGELVGINNGTILNCSSSGTVTNVSGCFNLGGLVGSNHGNIGYSHSSTTVTGGSNSCAIGGLIGYNYNPEPTICPRVYNCYSTGTVTGTGTNSNDVGGLVGLHESVYGIQGPVLDTEAHIIIEKCFSTSNVTGKYRVGGLVGKSYNHTGIINSYARGSVNITAPAPPNCHHGGLVGYKGFVSYITNCYSTGLINPGLSGGGLVGYSTETGYITSSYWDTDLSQIGVSAGGSPLTSVQMEDITNYIGWDFTNVWDQLSNVNDNYPFIMNVTPISDALEPLDSDLDGLRNITIINHLRWISENSNSWTLAFELDRNINAAKTVSWNNGLGFTPIGNASTKFTGYFQGNDKTIDSLYINRPYTDYVGLFGFIQNSVVQSIQLTHCDITGSNYVGGLCGMFGTYSPTPLPPVPSAGMVYCGTSGKIVGTNYVGGLIGKVDIFNVPVYHSVVGTCASKCEVYGYDYIGGLIGYNEGQVSNSYSRGAIESLGDYAGGFVGYNDGEIFKSYSTGYVDCPGSNAYGFAGGTSGDTAPDSFWDSDLTISDPYSGIGKTTTEMKSQISPTIYEQFNWDFIYCWQFEAENDNYPGIHYSSNFKRNIDNNEFNISTKNIDVDIYPNPVSAETKLIINLDEDIYANIHIYNTLGQKVKSCYSGEIAKGTKEINLNLQDLNEGSYYVIIENNSVLSCKTIIISR